MLTMLDPNEIRLSILRGQKSDNCQVFRGSASEGRRFALKYALFYIIGYTVLFSIFSTWMQYFLHRTPALNVEPLVIDIVISALMGIVAFCIIPATAKNSAIVLFPEGWIAFNDIQYNLPKMQKFISYASLTDVQLNYNFFGPYLVLRYHEGKAHKWSPNNYLARSAKMMILQSILVDYVTYKRSFKECL